MPRQPRQQQQGSVIAWGLSVLLGVTAAVWLLGKALDATSGLLGGTQPTAVSVQPPVPETEPQTPPEQAPAPSTAQVEPVATPPAVGVDSVAVSAEGRVRLYEIVWRAPAGAALRFDARRFTMLSFERRGARCAIAVPTARSWSRPTDRSADGRRISERRLLTRGASERLEAQALAARLKVPDAAIEDCDAVAARVEPAGGAGAVLHSVQCGGDDFEPISSADWAALVAAHNRLRGDNVGIRADGLFSPPAAQSQLRTRIEAGVYCTNADPSARARLLAAVK